MAPTPSMDKADVNRKGSYENPFTCSYENPFTAFDPYRPTLTPPSESSSDRIPTTSSASDSSEPQTPTSESSVEGAFMASRREGLRHLLSNKEGIIVAPESFLQFGGVQIGTPMTKSLIVHNKSDEGVCLNGLHIHGIQNVCKFTVATAQKPESDTILAYIEPRGICSVNVTCNAEMMGRTTDFLMLEFEHCQIGRLLRATALSTETNIIQELKIRKPGLQNSWQEVNDITLNRIMEEREKKCEFVKGINPLRQPFFSPPKRLKRYNLPTYLWNIVAEDDEDRLMKKHPCITEDLNMQNYMDKFQIGLWLEELENVIIRRQYDLEYIFLQPASNGQVKFDVPCLKDIRPPVLVSDPICIIDTDGGKKYQAFIYDIKDDTVFTKLTEDCKIKCRETRVTVEFRQGRALYRRCHFAVENAIGYLGEGWLFPKDFETKCPRISFVENDVIPSSSGNSPTDAEPDKLAEEKPRLFLFRRRQIASKVLARTSNAFGKGNKNIERRMPSIMSPFKSNTRGPGRRTASLSWFNKVLNDEQKNAVRGILRGECRPLPYIIFGPPGTGKTVTIVEAVVQVYKLDKFSRTLVVAPSNSAVDRIAELLINSGQFVVGDFVRLIGFLRTENQIRETVRPFCVDGDEIAKVAGHRLIISTCSTAGQFHQLNLETGHFTHVFVDEAGYCTEPESLVAGTLVTLQHSGQLVLAGDPKQLGPVLMSRAAKVSGLSLSLLERLTNYTIYARNENDFPVEHYNPALITKLVKNYRAHPNLLELPSRLFYDRELVAAADVNSVSLYKSLDFMKHRNSPVLFHGVQGNAFREKASPSWFNTAEIIQVVYYVRKLRENGVETSDIGIITPYRQQVEKLRLALQLVLNSETDLPRIGSVEEFQGDERQVIILSLVRSTLRDEKDDENELCENQDHLTFIFSDKRFNVAITRAKSVLIVLGNPHVLVKDSTWNSFLKHCVDEGSYTGCNLPSTLQFRPQLLNLVAQVQQVPTPTPSECDSGIDSRSPSPVTPGFGSILNGIAKFTRSIMMSTAASIFNVQFRRPSIADTESEEGSDVD